MTFLTLSGSRIEYSEIAGPAAAPPLVFLHEGLGSLAMWRDFPARLAAAAACPAVIYSRIGYGQSTPHAAPLAVDYMRPEAENILPALRQALGLAAPILVGHSDGASIALLHAAAGVGPVKALILEAPHVFVEDISIAGITVARTAYDEGDLRPRLARYHADVEGVFRGWNDIWLSPAFRGWNIEDRLAAIECPILLIQGADDPYGTLAQLDAIERRVAGPCERVVLAACGHAPHREQEEATLAVMTDFIRRCRTSEG